MMKIVYVLFAVLCSLIIFEQTTFAQTNENVETMFNQASRDLVDGKYQKAITVYDNILKEYPNNVSTLKMKGIAKSNLDEHVNSLKSFFKVLQYKSNDVISLTGMGVGFGNLGEYQEAAYYFEKASSEKPDSVVINNYKDFINGVISKYPYTPTQKPKDTTQVQITSIPEWVKPIAKWWSEENIDDSEFNSALTYLIKNKIIQIPLADTLESDKINPENIKSDAGLWADKQIDDETFALDIKHLVKNGSIILNVENKPQKSQDELNHEFYLFEKYLRDISKNITKEKRYIEYANPSKDVIKKFLRDYAKWNYGEQAINASGSFPNPTYEIKDDVYIIYYKIFISEQPTGLPLDHASTLKNSFAFWEDKELIINNKNAKIKFYVTNLKHEANVWVTWVVRNLGDGVLGHASPGKGIVEVTLGDYICDGSFQLYDIDSVETIMTHELGHSIGLKHVDDKNNIMYPASAVSYAYCLLN